MVKIVAAEVLSEGQGFRVLVRSYGPDARWAYFPACWTPAMTHDFGTWGETVKNEEIAVADNRSETKTGGA